MVRTTATPRRVPSCLSLLILLLPSSLTLSESRIVQFSSIDAPRSRDVSSRRILLSVNLSTAHDQAADQISLDTVADSSSKTISDGSSAQDSPSDQTNVEPAIDSVPKESIFKTSLQGVEPVHTVSERFELPETLHSEQLEPVLTDYYRYNGEALHCQGGECPDLEGCLNEETLQEKKYPDVSSCHIPELSDENFGLMPMLAPVTCPFIDSVGLSGKPRLWFNESCSHHGDQVPIEPYLAEFYLIKKKSKSKSEPDFSAAVKDLRLLDEIGYFFDRRGNVFNSTHYFFENGCSGGSLDAYTAGAPLFFFDRIINFANFMGCAFYHGIVEDLPLFILLAKSNLLKTISLKDVPLSLYPWQLDFFHHITSHILGIKSEFLNVRLISDNELFFAREIYSPKRQMCGRPHIQLWTFIRENYFLPSQGFPVLNPDFSLRKVPKDKSQFPPNDWVVILARRKGERELLQEEQIYAQLVSLFPKERVVVYDGNLFITDAKKLFNKAVMLVAVHGALMTNMLFMNPRGSILEMRPREYDNSCYHHLSQICLLNYYLHLCEGSKESSTDCAPIIEQVFATLETMKAELFENLNLQ